MQYKFVYSDVKCISLPSKTNCYLNMNSSKYIQRHLIVLLLGFYALSVKAGDTKPAVGEQYNPTPDVMHHIADAHQFQIWGDLYLPLPCIAYSSEGGFFFSLSSAFENGKKAVDGYVIHHDQLKRVKDPSFPKGVVDIQAPGEANVEAPKQIIDTAGVQTLGAVDMNNAVVYGGKAYELEAASTVQGITSWFDFSITKNVFSMLLGTLLLLYIFGSISKAYKRREGQSPKGMQSLFEPVIVFMRDEVIKSAIGPRWESYFPFLMSLFFFILINNMLGLVPFFPGSANVTGNIGVTLVLAVFAFLVTNLSGNRHYWQHIFWMPGVPTFVKFILTPIEVLGIFIKPFTLLIRLFANITAGHIMILSLTSLIFVFSNLGESIPGAFAGGVIAVPFVFAMNFLELLVAFLQAFIFTLLVSLYIGSAVEEHHHEEEHGH